MKTDASLRAKGTFLADYAALLLDSGATCIRLERNVSRMADALRCSQVMTILPRHIHITVTAPDTTDSFTYIAATRAGAISYDRNTRLSELSWELADGRITFDEARIRLNDIAASPGAGRWSVLLLASAANASFCRLFGGDAAAMAVVFIATMAGFYVKQTMASNHADMRLTFIVCAFISSVLGAGAGLFGLGTTPAVALGTSVLYLVPGIPLLNSFSDLLAGHYICSFCRLTHAVILTSCLSIGLCCGMFLMGTGMF